VKEITFDALRWMEEPVRIKIFPDGDHPRGYFQITSPREVEGLCQGRPVEELPRILSILSPAHHLASALALDKLFGVEPPPLAVTMREALLQTLFFESISWSLPGLILYPPPSYRETAPRGFRLLLISWMKS